MQHCQRLDQKLHSLCGEIRTMTREKELEEQVWRDRLRRCQWQLKVKEEEMNRQSQSYENYRGRLHHKLSLAWDREQGLQKRIYALEKQLLDMTVCAATGMATTRAPRITAGIEKHLEEQERLPSTRGEGEGEEEKKEHSSVHAQPKMPPEWGESKTSVNGKTQAGMEGSENKTAEGTVCAARLQGFINSLQEDLRVLLEREEAGMTERYGLVNQLQEAQEKNHLLACEVEKMKGEIENLREFESSRSEEFEELREENQKLQQVLNHCHPRLSTNSKLACTSPHDTSVISIKAAPCVIPSMRNFSSSGSGEDRAYLTAVPPVDHQATAKCNQNGTGFSSSSDIGNNLSKPKSPIQFFRKPKGHFQSFSFTTESFGKFEVRNIDECPSEECDALRRAYQSLGFEEDLKEGCDAPCPGLPHAKDQMAQEELLLETKPMKDGCAVQTGIAQSALAEETATLSSCDVVRPPSPGDDVVFDFKQEDLIQALNQENRALATRIQELLTHTVLLEEEKKKEGVKLKEEISRLREHVVQLEQERDEQSCLILELTRKTEDDLNTILDLQQKLTEVPEVKNESNRPEAQGQIEHLSTPGNFQQNYDEEHKRSLFSPLLKVKGALLSPENNKLPKVTLADQCKNSIYCNDNSIQDSNLDLFTDQKAQLANSVQNLNKEQEELDNNIKNLREQQKEVTALVQTQTEEKQKLTRAIWTLKEEKDHICESLSVVKQEKEKLTKTVCVLKNEKDQMQRIIGGLTEKEKQLTTSLSSLEKGKEAIKTFISSREEEKIELLQTLKHLQTERDRLSQMVLEMTQQKDKLNTFVKCSIKQNDTKEKMQTLKLEEKVIGLNETEFRNKLSVFWLNREMETNLHVRDNLHHSHVETQTEDTSQKKQQSGLVGSDSNIPTMENASKLKCVTCTNREEFLQEKNDLCTTIEGLKAQLKKLQEELQNSHAEMTVLRSDLSQSDSRRREAESKEAAATDEMDDIMSENKILNFQVKELQNKLMGLVREKTDALSLKTQAEERLTVLTAELKAKTVALEELNSEYRTLKQGKGSMNDLKIDLASLRTRYNDIRAKYDELLKRRCHADLDVVPLKAKLSSLVMKCEERNSLLLQMLKALQRQGCANWELTQQVEHVLSDVALQDYSAAFTSGNNSQKQDFSLRFTQDFMPKAKDKSCQTHTNSSTFGGGQENKHQRAEREQQSDKSVNEPCMNMESYQNVTDVEVESQMGKISEKKFLVKENGSSETLLEESVIPNCSKTSAASGTAPAVTWPGKPELNDFNMKERSSLDPVILKKSFQGSSPLVCSRRRLGSPEKILNMHQQLQRALMSSSQVSENRGREKQPKRTQSLTITADLNSARRKTQNSSFTSTHPSSLTASPSPTESVALTTSKSVIQSATLATAVAARSANATSISSLFTNHNPKATFNNTESSPSVSLVPSNDQSILGAPYNAGKSSNQTKKTTSVSDTCDYTQAHSSPIIDCNMSTPKTNSCNGSITRASSGSRINLQNTSLGSMTLSDSCTSSNSAGDPATVHEKSGWPKAEAPDEVQSVSVIRIVGQSGLLIGWERPPLDELGCSNGTFVYGYRVFVDGDFHKSVMSSACTKCILENMDLSVPVQISVQTLGSNGLRSNAVCITYMMSDQRC